MRYKITGGFCGIPWLTQQQLQVHLLISLSVLFCPLVSQHMPPHSMASLCTTSTQSYLISSTVSGCLFTATSHKTYSTPVLYFVCMEHFPCHEHHFGVSPVARSWVTPVVEHSMAASDLIMPDPQTTLLQHGDAKPWHEANPYSSYLSGN